MSGGANAAAWFISLLLSTAPVSAIAGKIEIRIKLVNALTGRPYAGRHAGLFGTNAAPGEGLHANEVLFHLQTKTGPDGVAEFVVAAPLPLLLIPDVRQNGGCAWHGAAPIITSGVLTSGYVGPNECARKNQSFHWQDVKAEPGEIILLVVEPRGP